MFHVGRVVYWTRKADAGWKSHLTLDSGVTLRISESSLMRKLVFVSMKATSSCFLAGRITCSGVHQAGRWSTLRSNSRINKRIIRLITERTGGVLSHNRCPAIDDNGLSRDVIRRGRGQEYGVTDLNVVPPPVRSSSTR